MRTLFAERALRVKFIMAMLVLAVLVSCVTLVASPAPALAEPSADTTSSSTYIRDHYDLFSSVERAELESQAKALSQKCDCGVYLVTVADIGSYTVRDYAKSYYQKYNVGVGSSKSGIMFLIAVDSRDYVTITYGNGTTVFTDYQIENLEEAVVDKISDNKWYEGAQAYLSECDEAITFYVENGEPLDSHNAPKNYPLIILISLVIALVGGAGITYGFLHGPLRAMRTARTQSEASNYVDREHPVVLTHQHDTFRTTTVSVVHIERDNDNFGGGGSTIDSGGFGGSSGGKF